MHLLRRRFAFSGLLLVIVASSSPAGAVDLWIQPEPLSPQPGQQVRLRLFRGEPFAGEEQPFHEANANRFQRIWKSGRSNLTGREGAKPLGRFRAEEPGVQLVAYASKNSGAYCKAVLVVGKAGPGNPLRWSEVGHRLEIVPQTDPVLLIRSGGSLEVQILYEREPLAGVRVHAYPAAAPANGARSAVTDEIGLAKFKLDRPGPWMVRVAHQDPGAGGSKATERTLTATLVLAAGEQR